MRVPLLTAVAVLAAAGCSSGTRTIVVVQRPATPVTTAPAPVVARPPAPIPMAPLEVALGRPSAGKLIVQTNRPAYVAIFEIVPSQGVVLAHPSSLRQSTMTLSGISSLPVTWVSPAVDHRVSDAGRPMRATRYLYAIASDKPLRVPDAAFRPGYLEQLLGPGLYRAATPQPVTQALARHFAPSAVDGKWAQDMYTMAPSDETAPHRVARIYCPGGTVYEVPENIASRSWCPKGNGRGRAVGQQTVDADESSSAPDSVVGHNGSRVGRGIGQQGRGVGPSSRVDARPEQVSPRATPDPRKPEHAANPETGRAGKERLEKERAEKERAEKERVEKARVEHERAVKDRLEKDRIEKDRMDKLRAENERFEKERFEKERAERDRVEKERTERDRSENERLAKERAESERLARENADREAAEAEKVEKEKVEKEKVEKENAEREKAELEKAEKDKAAKLKADQEKAETEKAEKEKTEKEKAEKEKAEKEKADKEKADKEKADKEKADKEKADREKADADDKGADKSRTRPPGKGGPPTEPGHR